MNKKILIVGPIQVGKTTLIEKIAEETNLLVTGFVTKKEDKKVFISLPDKKGKMQIGTADNKILDVNIENLDVFSDILRKNIRKDSLVIMDEIGIMETKSQKFCDAIKEILSNDYLVLAAVKNKDNPFLNEIKSMGQVFNLDESNRESIYEQIRKELFGNNSCSR